MTNPFQTRTLKQIRQSIGYGLNDMTLVTATTTVDTSSLIGTLLTLPGGDDEYNGRYLYAATPTGSIVAAEKSRVSDFASATYDITASPVFSASITNADIFELWKIFTVEEVNDVINQAVMEVSRDCLKIKQLTTQYSDGDEYEYNALSSFVGLFQVEWEYDAGIEKIIHNCDTVWNESVDADVTATADTTLYKEGTGSLKLVVAAGASAGDILATEDISSLDLTECDKLEIWIYSSVALSAGDLQVLLDNTASCASPVESLNIPATTASTWTRHIISLANPQNDSAVISVGLKMVNDKGAFTLYADGIRAVLSTSKDYHILNPEMWRIIKDGTPYLKLTANGLNLVGDGTQLRLTGYQLPALLSADTTESDIDPAWLINKVIGELMLNHSKSSRLDIQDRARIAQARLTKAEHDKMGIRIITERNVRWIS